MCVGMSRNLNAILAIVWGPMEHSSSSPSEPSVMRSTYCQWKYRLVMSRDGR